MGRWVYYDVRTGRLTGRTFQGPDESAQANALPGSAALQVPDDAPVPGRHTHRVDVDAVRPDGAGDDWQPPVVGWRPPAPADDELHRWIWDAASQQWAAQPTLEALRRQRWAALRAQRDAVEFGGFGWDGSRFDSDAVAQARIMGAVQMAVLAAADGQPFSIAWTLADNQVRVLDGGQMIGVGLALGAHVGAAHATGRTLRALLQAAATPAEVAAVTWPQEP